MQQTKKIMAIFMLALISAVFSSQAVSIESLRGDTALDGTANKAGKHKLVVEEGGFERNFKLQPPLIPHSIDKYQINLKNNGCMKCHSEKAYVKENAPKVGDSHYVTRDGKTLDTISSRRYFCNQCHVPQVGDNPLVENTYEGID